MKLDIASTCAIWISGHSHTDRQITREIKCITGKFKGHSRAGIDTEGFIITVKIDPNLCVSNLLNNKVLIWISGDKTEARHSNTIAYRQPVVTAHG